MPISACQDKLMLVTLGANRWSEIADLRVRLSGGEQYIPFKTLMKKMKSPPVLGSGITSGKGGGSSSPFPSTRGGTRASTSTGCDSSEESNKLVPGRGETIVR